MIKKLIWFIIFLVVAIGLLFAFTGNDSSDSGTNNGAGTSDVSPTPGTTVPTTDLGVAETVVSDSIIPTIDDIDIGELI